MTKVIAFDLDGTLLNGNNEIFNKRTTLEYLREFKALGYKLVINTGRLDHDIQHICKIHDLDIDVRISQNGCVMNDDVKLEASLIHKQEAQAVYQNLKKYDVRVELNTISNRYWHTERDPDFPKEFYDSSILRDDFTAVIESQPCVLFLVIGDETSLGAIQEHIQKDYQEIHAVRTSGTSLEIVPKGTSKGIALDDYFDAMTLYAIGDSENDYSMFDKADHAYLVGNESYKKAINVSSIDEALQDIKRIHDGDR